MKATFLLLFSLLMMQSPAMSFEIINGCNLINNLEEEKMRDFLVEKYSKLPLHTSIDKDYKEKFYTTNHLIENFYETLPFRSEVNSQKFVKKMTATALKKILTNQQYYLDILTLNDIGSSKNEMLECLKNDKNYSELANLSLLPTVEDDPKLYEAFIMNQFIFALQVQVIFDQITDAKKLFQQQVLKIKKSFSKLRRGIYRKQEVEEIRLKKIQFADKVVQIESQLNDLVKKSPLLFKYTSNISLAEKNSTQLKRSQLQKKLISGMDPQLMKQMKDNYLQIQNVSAFTNVIFNPANKKSIDTIALSKVYDVRLKEFVRQQLSAYINDVNKGAKKLCQNGGRGLHHDDGLVNDTLNENANRKEYSLYMTQDFAGYCFLKKKYPPQEESETTVLSGLGYSLLAIGGATQVFIGVGNVVGSILMGTGTALLTAENAIDSYASTVEEKKLLALQLGGWSHFRENLKTLQKTNDLMFQTGQDIALSAGVFSLSKYFSRSKFSFKETESEKLLKNWEENFSLNTLNLSKEHRKTFQENKEFFREIIASEGFKRGQINRALLQNGSVEAKALYKALIWQRTISMWKKYADSPNRYKLDNRIEWFRTYNRNPMPAYYMYGQSGDKIYQVLDILSDSARLGTKDGHEAQRIVKDLFARVSSHPKLIDETSDEAFLAFKRVPELKEATKKFGPSDFVDGQKQAVWLTEEVHGKYIKVQREFVGYYELVTALRKEELHSIYNLARNAIEEILKKSKLYNIMHTQAEDYLSLKFLIKTLEKIPAKSRGKIQKEFLKSAQSHYKTAERTTRPSALEHIKLKILISEIRDTFRGLKNKEKLLARLDIKLSKKAAEKAEESGGVAKYFKTIVIIGSTGLTTEYGRRWLQSGGSLDEINSRRELLWNDFTRNFNNGFTSAEKSCAQEPRKFSFDLCFAALVRTELGVVRARAIVTEDYYTYQGDSEVKIKIYELAYNMLMLRKKYRAAESYYLGMKLLNEVYLTHSIREIVDVIDKLDINKQDIGARVAQILTANTKEKAAALLIKFNNEFDGRFSDSVKYFLDHKEDILTTMKESGRLPQDLELMLRGLDFETADHDINGDNFFRFTLESLNKIRKGIESIETIETIETIEKSIETEEVLTSKPE